MTTGSSVNEALGAATRLLDAGRAQDALEALSDLAGAHPARADVTFHMARAQAALGDLDGAQAGFETALQAAPKEPSIWMEYALLAHHRGEAKAFAKRLRSAGLPQALVTMAMAASTGAGARAVGAGAASKGDLAGLSKAAAAGDAKRTEAMAQPLLRKRAGALIFAHLGAANLRAGQGARAVEAFRQGLRLEPYAEDLRLGLVRALARAGQGASALSEARILAAHAPAWGDAQLAFGRLCLGAGLRPLAAKAAQSAVRLSPKSAQARRLAAEVALAEGDGEAAIAHLRALPKSDASLPMLMGHAASLTHDTDAALRHFDRARDAAPKDPEPLVARAQVLQSLGQAEEAEADLRAALALAPDHGMAARALAYGTRLVADDPLIAALEAALAKASPDNARLLSFALGRIYEKTNPARSFAHLEAANGATAKLYPFAAAEDAAELARVTSQDWPIVAALPDSTCDAAPIFVTGLPRSGTTLVETILAAHPDVRAGGELAVLGEVCGPAEEALRGGARDTVLTELGAAYAEAAARAAGPGAARHLTDKSIHTFVRLGLLRRALPQGRFVVVQRDPRDTALSIWRNHFRDGTHRYAASWDGIAHHIRLFRDAVGFWRDALPDGAFHEIWYEALLDDPEGQSRALLEACGLTWDDRVLRYHEQASRVDTLSFAQVRQPIYRSSQGGWRKHEAYLGDMLAALEAHGVDLPADSPSCR